MNALATLFLLINVVALLALPRRWAVLPLLLGTCYMTMGQGFNLGPFSFTVSRMLIAVGLIRVLARGEALMGGLNAIDRIVLLWGGWCLASGLFRDEAMDALIFRSGRAYNIVGIYFLIRIFLNETDSVRHFIKLIAILLIPVSVEMVFEQVVGRNLFGVLLGGVGESPNVRNGSLRAQGPFRHAILAGTVGAVCFPLLVGVWKGHRKVAIVGGAACLVMVFASVSSGPIMSLLAGGFALVMWRYRHLTRTARWLALIAYIALDIVMTRPAYYLVTKIDLTGGSTAYHRAQLINSSFKHLDEWWLSGTDYTRHWMPTGVSWSPDHTDITNQYIAYGVWGGLLLMLLFVWLLGMGFAFVGRVVRSGGSNDNEKLMAWTLGCSLFAHAATSFSVAYYDQSFMFLYATLAAISSMYTSMSLRSQEAPQQAIQPGFEASPMPPPAYGLRGY